MGVFYAPDYALNSIEMIIMYGYARCFRKVHLAPMHLQQFFAIVCMGWTLQACCRPVKGSVTWWREWLAVLLSIYWHFNAA